MENMKRVKVLSALAIVLLIAFIIAVQSGKLFGAADTTSSSSDEKIKYTATFLDIFDTRTEIVGYAYNEEEFSEQASIIKDRLVFYNNLFDIYNDYDGISNIKTINESFLGKTHFCTRTH